MKTYLFLIILLAATHLEIYSQVTIGSAQAPVQGALLELTQGAVTTKGLMLPKVALSVVNELKMGDNALPASEYLNHQGLMVYNVSEIDNCPSSTSFSKGLYVWDGELWQQLTKATNDGVTEHKDQDGNKFLAGQFGTAGVWMLENLRALKYDPQRDGIDPTNDNMVGPTFNDDFDYFKGYWVYPMPDDGAADPTNASFYNANPSLGLLYTWGAASRGQDNAYNEEGGEGTPGHPIVIRQGICPSGWHLPTDKEWTLLENEIQSNTSKYSTMADIGGTGTIGESSTANLLSPMTDKCEPHTNWTAGTSKPKEKGGFAGLLAGKIEGTYPAGYGQSAYYWTGSMNHYLVHSRVIDPENFGEENLIRTQVGPYTMASVRCKKN